MRASAMPFQEDSVEGKLLDGRESNLHSYFAYGLGIESALPIPEFIPGETRCDVTIGIERDRTIFDYVPKEVIEEPLALNFSSEEAVVYLKDAGVFLVQGGRQIVVIPAPEASEHLIRLALVGTVMAILLHQRGLLVLHASVVNMQGGAVAFLGNSGEGKSSMAAALYARGYCIITDDVAPVSWDQGKAAICPGFPQIKLSREVADCLGYHSNELQLLHPQLKKRGYRLRQDFPQLPLPIRRIYVLESGDEVKIEPLKPHETVMELSRHSRLTSLVHAGEASHFLGCAKLAKEFNVYRLQRPRNLALLPELVGLVERDVNGELVPV